MIKLKVKSQVAAALVALALILSFSTAQADTAKNVIFMISDGWGYNQIKATNYYNGTTEAYENFSVKYGMSTYSASNPAGYDPSQAWTNFNYVKSGATDSASAATAMATGIKNYDGQINWYTNQMPITGEDHRRVSPRTKAKPPALLPRWSSATPPRRQCMRIILSRNNYAEIANEMLDGGRSMSSWAPVTPAMTTTANTCSRLKPTNYVGGKRHLERFDEAIIIPAIGP